jgi:hypothetical protein
MAVPIPRLRRLRQHEAFRRMVRERKRWQEPFLGAWWGSGACGLVGQSRLFGSTNERDKTAVTFDARQRNGLG